MKHLDISRQYEVTITTSRGCTSSDNIEISVFKGSEIYVPSAFTPNGDRLNEIFKANPVGLKKFNYFKIYNRWGEMLFSTMDSKYGWDGTFHGHPQPVGIYIWLAEGIAINGSIIRQNGTVTLLR